MSRAVLVVAPRGFLALHSVTLVQIFKPARISASRPQPRKPAAPARWLFRVATTASGLPIVLHPKCPQHAMYRMPKHRRWLCASYRTTGVIAKHPSIKHKSASVTDAPRKALEAFGLCYRFWQRQRQGRSLDHSRQVTRLRPCGHAGNRSMPRECIVRPDEKRRLSPASTPTSPDPNCTHRQNEQNEQAKQPASPAAAFTYRNHDKFARTGVHPDVPPAQRSHRLDS